MNWSEVADITPGYLLPEEPEVLHRWASQTSGLAVEIGSFAGKSTVCIASAVDHLVSIDPHHGNPEMQPGRECFIPEAWDEHDGVVDSLPLLRRTLRLAGVEHKVTCIAALSGEVAKWWAAPIGFLFIDGDHGSAAKDDYLAWSPHLTDDAVLCFHDTAIPDIKQACDKARADGWRDAEEVGGCLRVFVR